MIIAFSAVMFFSVLAFWRQNTLMFMLAAGASLMVGFYWYDTYTNNLGLTIGLMLIANSLVCVGFGLGCVFRRGKSVE